MAKATRKQARAIRHKRIRARIYGRPNVPRLCVFRSLKHIYAQIIDDENNAVLLAASDFEIKEKPKSAKQPLKQGVKAEKRPKKVDSKALASKTGVSFQVGKLIAKKAAAKKITKVVFDRAGYKYHGRVKALAQGAREGGLIF